MVNINFTLVVELALFLIFLWGTARFILRPALETLDAREEKIEREHAESKTANREASALESKYARAITGAREEAEAAFREVHTRAVEAHTATMAEARRAVDERVLKTREQGSRALKEQRGELLKAAPALAEELRRNLGIGGPAA